MFGSSESDLDRCHPLITESRGGLPQPQLLGRVNPTALAWRQAARPKISGSQSLSALDVR
eukprot:5245426-Amphidinium_carterae.1